MTMYRFSQCKCVVYCPKLCQKRHWKHHKDNCKTFRHPTWTSQNRANGEYKTFVSHLTPSKYTKIAKLVGRWCTVRCLLNDIESQVLWDTGAQVSILSREIMEKFFNKTTVRDISELIDKELNSTVGNGTKITYSGWVEIEVRLTSSSKDEPSVMVPFLITNENLEYHILGYNVIEELVQPVNLLDDQSTHVAAVQASFQDLDEIVLLDLIELIQGTKADRLCTIKSSKRDVVIPAKRTVQVNCRANTGPVEEAMAVLFEPDELTPWPQGLAIHEMVTTVKRGSTSKIKIDVISKTNHDIVLQKHTILGSLQLVKSIKPVEVKLAENAGEGTETSATVSRSQVTMTEKGTTREENTSDDEFLPDIDLTGLTEQQCKVAIAMLREECHSFARNDEDIGCINDLELGINLTTNKPVQKNYVSVPRPLYPEVNQHIHLQWSVSIRKMEHFDNLWFSVLDQGKAYHQGLWNRQVGI